MTPRSSDFGVFFFARSGAVERQPTQGEILPGSFCSTGVGIMNAVATGSGCVGVLLPGFLKQEVGLAGIFAGIRNLRARRLGLARGVSRVHSHGYRAGAGGGQRIAGP